MAHSEEQNEWTETVLEEAHTLDLLDKDFKSFVLNMLKGIRENMERKSGRYYMSNKVSTKIAIKKKELKRNTEAEKYNSWNEKFTGGDKQHMWVGKRKN